jgi:hypothetical protein
MSEEKTLVEFGQKGIELRSLDEAWRFGQAIIEGGMAPKNIRGPGAVVALIQAGAELGLPPMWSLSNLTFVNGKLGIMGDAARALVRKSGLMEPGTDFVVTYSGKEATLSCTVTAHRKGMKQATESTFSIADAKKAGILKGGPWQSYPKRMLMYRALGFLVRDLFGDVLQGLVTSEELGDYPKQKGERVVNPDQPPPKRHTSLLSGVIETPSTKTSEPAAEIVVEASEPDGGSVPEESPEEVASPPPDSSPFGDCAHPEGFSAMDDENVRICIECGAVEPEADPDQGSLL